MLAASWSRWVLRRGLKEARSNLQGTYEGVPGIRGNKGDRRELIASNDKGHGQGYTIYPGGGGCMPNVTVLQKHKIATVTIKNSACNGSKFPLKKTQVSSP